MFCLFCFGFFYTYSLLFPIGTTPPMQIPGLPPEFMQAIVHQISQQAAAMATAATASHHGQQTGVPGPTAQSGESPATPLPPQARVVITRPSFSPHIPQPGGARGTTINLRATVPPTASQQPGQVRHYWFFHLNGNSDMDNDYPPPTPLCFSFIAHNPNIRTTLWLLLLSLRWWVVWLDSCYCQRIQVR